MARPYSVDLRERVLQAHEAGEGSQRMLAERFAVSVGTVCAGGWALPAAKAAGVHGRRMVDGVRWVGRIRRSWPGWSRRRMMRRWRSIARAWPSAPGCGSVRRRSAGR